MSKAQKLHSDSVISMTQIKFNADSVELKIAVLGKSLVGKSALTYRLINDKFPTDHDTTIEDQYRININLDGIECRLEILDTAGQDDYQTMLDSWISYADAFVLVYSIDDRESFDVIKSRYDRILKNKGGDKVPIIIAGNKCDLELKRKVDKKAGEEIAEAWKVDFLEVSALNKINVSETFLCVAKELLNKKLKNSTKLSKDKEVKKRCYCF